MIVNWLQAQTTRRTKIKNKPNILKKKQELKDKKINNIKYDKWMFNKCPSERHNIAQYCNALLGIEKYKKQNNVIK